MSNIFDLFKKIESAREEKVPVTHIVCGLGNVGKTYERTRHNAGFTAVDHIADTLGVRIDRVKFHAAVCECKIGDKGVLLMKPTTLMNNSGIAVSEAARFYKIPPENVIILHDEISFDPGRIRIRRKGSAGGHNGLKSIIEHLGSQDFPRIKIGVGQKPNPEYDLADFVLSRLPDADAKAISDRFPDVCEAVKLIISGDIETAMQRYSK